MQPLGQAALCLCLPVVLLLAMLGLCLCQEEWQLKAVVG